MYILENYVRESRTQCLDAMYPASRVSFHRPSRKMEGGRRWNGESARRVDDMSSLTNALFLPLHVRTSRGLIWENKTYKLKVYFPGGGTLHMKGVGMLVVSLRGVNFGFWSHLGYSGQNAIIFSREGLV